MKLDTPNPFAGPQQVRCRGHMTFSAGGETIRQVRSGSSLSAENDADDILNVKNILLLKFIMCPFDGHMTRGTCP